MNLHEYQGKQLLKSFGVTIQEGKVAETVEEAVSVNDDEELSNKGSEVDSESSTNIPEVDEDESSSPEDEKK